jgi:tetratricopeptide (TPR) repeat protein
LTKHPFFVKEIGMRKHLLALLPAIALLGVSAPANALVMVIGNQLAHDCYEMAKAGTDPVNGIATCSSALENEALSAHDRAGTYVNRGAIKMAINRVDDAMNDYNTGITIMPGLADAYVDRAGAYIMQRKFDLAMTDVNHGIEAYYDYQKTLELEPKFAPAAEHLKDFVVTKVPAGAKPPG